MEPLPGKFTPPPHLDGPALVRRAAALLWQWIEIYGEHQPEWLPPAGVVNWQEDAGRYLDAHTLPAVTPPSNGPQMAAAAVEAIVKVAQQTELKE